MNDREKITASFFQQIDDRIILGGLVIASIIGFFITDLFGNGAVVQAIRIFLLGLIFVSVYFLWSGFPLPEDEGEGEEEEEDRARGIETLLAIRGTGEMVEPEERFNFYQELNEFFENLIRMVRATFVAHSSVLFLKADDPNYLRIEFCDSEASSLHRGDLIEIEGSLPGSVFRNRTAVLEKNIPDSAQAAGYYREDVTIKSFLGVPVTIKGEVRGVLAVDSLVAHDFSDNDLELLKSYERLISQGIGLLGERERSYLTNQSLKAIEIFLAEINEELSLENIYASLGKACRSIFQFDRLTIARLEGDEGQMAKIVKVLGQRDAMGEGFQFPLSDGLMGWVVRKGKPLLLEDLEKGDLFRPRYSKDDKSNYGLRSFLGVPIMFQNRVFGAISLESRQPDFYTEWDQYTLELLAVNSGLAMLAAQFVPPG